MSWYIDHPGRNLTYLDAIGIVVEFVIVLGIFLIITG
jgi:hypothetical protein